MCLIVLHDLFTSEIKHADGLIVGAGEDALISRVEIGASDGSLEAVISLHFLLLLDIPNQEFLILASRAYQTHLCVDFSTIDPVVMSKQRTLELLRIAVPQLDALIITSRQDSLAIIEETD